MLLSIVDVLYKLMYFKKISVYFDKLTVHANKSNTVSTHY